MDAEKTAKKSTPGIPFTKDDPRINREGRPKGSGISITTAIKRELEKRPEGSDKATYLDLLVKRIMKKAIQEGDTHTIKQIWNYVDGMPAGSLDLTTKGDKINLNVINYGDYSAPQLQTEGVSDTTAESD